MKRISMIVAVAATASLSAAPPSQVRDYYGKWELLLANSGDTFQSAMLDLGEKDGQPAAALVWKWGGVQRFGGKDAFSVDKNGALVVRKRGWKEPLTLLRLGDAVQGSQGKVFVTGRLAKWEVDVSGKWDMTDADREEAAGTLTLVPLGANRYRAQAKNNDGHSIEIVGTEVKQNMLRLEFRDDEGNTLYYHAQVHGDQLVGQVENASGEVQFRANGARQRAWGQPVDLLADGMKGWRARDPRRKFGWKIADGVLTNAPPDVDIVSKAQFKDFKLELQYRVERPNNKRSNSGIYVRGRYEVQILDDWHEDPGRRRVQAHGNGAVYSRIVPAKFATRAPGEWQNYEITLIDRYLTVVLNGVTIVDNQYLEGITGGALDPFESDAGPLMLQGDHGKIEYRKVTVKPALSPSRPS